MPDIGFAEAMFSNQFPSPLLPSLDSFSRLYRHQVSIVSTHLVAKLPKGTGRDLLYPRLRVTTETPYLIEFKPFDAFEEYLFLQG